MHAEIPKSENEWKKKLTPEQYKILRMKETEPAFSGEYYHNKETGMYLCAGCGAPLFSSEDKYDSGSGWPSFDRAVDEKNIKIAEDTSHGMKRLEIMCGRCGGHLGHIFDDGPQETTGKRFCVNSASLKFKKM
ncbi:MAG: Peptide methionine sulfoxide reductase MsrB [Candidatus Uhrbacteria bacterium GW2011_GWA2_53_10]|uniref:peptide-methionine (R)-S-oxide reductase n=1 Tax=Candidatus Uhrbacteria bacterium GW2011_GWA2_53_10 TaxID=1618980 RepID=A0A0G1ZWJ5_9BACT|nr:MAG: Peptide methionine sulfoxide reductase MsrB [Candidatus Uhrbacteria bacterium GW2011_GWA2_53_10]